MIEYDAHDWRGHLFDIRGSMVREIIGRVTVCIAWSAAVVLVHTHWRHLDIPSTVHSLVGVALGLLLVFRTNASFSRYRACGATVVASRLPVTIPCSAKSNTSSDVGTHPRSSGR